MTDPVQNPPTQFNYRPDIDGLRAIAVLAVMAFHLGFAPLEGGFLGVDIFFVISGYLITSIIAPKMMKGTFSFKTFYLRRIRRLIPPALVTIAVTFMAAAFILDPSDMVAMAKSAIAATFSVSNILFFTETGYWDARSELKPLLHTWSLGVEEQFYLFWPLLVLALWKLMPRRNLGWAFAVVTLIGVFVSEWMLRANPSAAFYLLPARVFEFAIGACFALIGTSVFWKKISTKTIRSILGWASLIVLLATIWFYKGYTPFPGLNGLLPCLATAGLLLSGAGKSALPGLNFLLSNRLAVWTGRLSYSLYLVHWPVVSLMRYEVGLELGKRHQLFAAALIFVLTLMLYYGVERRVSARTGQASNQTGSQKTPKYGRFAIGTGISAVALSAVFAHAALNSGWTWRVHDLSFTPEQVRQEKARRFSTFVNTCTTFNFPDGPNCRRDAKINVLVIGNSHEPDGFNFFEAGYGRDPDIQFIRFEQTNRCKFGKEKGRIIAQGTRKFCQERVDKLADAAVVNKIQVIVYSANRPFEANKYFTLALLNQMKKLNPDLKLISMGGYINNQTPCFRIINETGNTASCMTSETISYTPLDDKDGTLFQAFMDSTDYYLDKGDLLCGEDIPASCESQASNRKPYTYDEHHLSLEFAQYAGRKFADENPNLLRELAGLSPR